MIDPTKSHGKPHANMLDIHETILRNPHPQHLHHGDLPGKAIQEEALVRASMSAVQDLEKAGDEKRSWVRSIQGKLTLGEARPIVGRFGRRFEEKK